MTREPPKAAGRETIQITKMEVYGAYLPYPNGRARIPIPVLSTMTHKPCYLFIFRFGIIHCIADFRCLTYLATTGSDQNLWRLTLGESHCSSLDYYQNLKQSLPILNLT